MGKQQLKTRRRYSRWSWSSAGFDDLVSYVKLIFYSWSLEGIVF